MATVSTKDKELLKEVYKYLDKHTRNGVGLHFVKSEKGKVIFSFKLESVTDIQLASHLARKFGLSPFKEDKWEEWISFTKDSISDFGGVF